MKTNNDLKKMMNEIQIRKLSLLLKIVKMEIILMKKMKKNEMKNNIYEYNFIMIIKYF